MTPKEKAKELYNKFYNTSSHQHHIESRKDNAKECAIIAVDEIRNDKFNEGILSGYWYEVRREIEKL